MHIYRSYEPYPEPNKDRNSNATNMQFFDNSQHCKIIFIKLNKKLYMPSYEKVHKKVFDVTTSLRTIIMYFHKETLKYRINKNVFR